MSAPYTPIAPRTDQPRPATIRVPVQVARRTSWAGRRVRADYTAGTGGDTLSSLFEAHGPTPKAAREALEQEVCRFLAQESIDPYVLWLPDESGVMLVRPGLYGTWCYEFHRPVRSGPAAAAPISAAADFVGGATDGFSTREDAFRAARAHWWALFGEPIVHGILGLCTDVREIVCRRCGSVTRTAPPYRCHAPGCGAFARPEEDPHG